MNLSNFFQKTSCFLAASELIPPAPFSWEEKGERWFVDAQVIFFKKRKSFQHWSRLFSPSLFKRRGRGMSSEGTNNLRNKLSLILILILCALTTTAHAQHQTLGPGSCGLTQNNCHAKENTWWKDDAHKVTVDAFYDDPAAYEKIAKLAGVPTDAMLKGNQSCMTCHGTIVSGKESREAEDGVSCESCHGPGSGYKDPHSEGDLKLGVQRSGYIKGLQLGMVELKSVDKRGAACVKCHYITDQKLISAGHPSGANFSYVSGIKKVAKHWRRPPADADLNKAPFEKAMNAKGPVAQIVKVEPPPPAPMPTATPTPEPAALPAASIEAPRPAIAPVVTRPSAPRATRPSAPKQEESMEMDQPIAPLALPPFPQVSDTTSVPQLLLLLKQRLELIYGRVRESNSK
jgi:hypothetical protein